jgi:vacuolar-type H+-ATPase subunit E/Vma4
MAAEAASFQNRAKLAALRAMADAREQLLVEAFAAAELHLREIRLSGEYPAVFDALAREALGALGAEDSVRAVSETAGELPSFIVRVDPDDAELARNVFHALGARVQLEPYPIPLGGVELATPDGRIVVVNTLAARLERAREEMRGPVASVLVGRLDSEKEWLATTTMPTPA